VRCHATRLAAGGRKQEREALLRFWSRVSRAASAGGPLTALFGDWAPVGSPLAWYAECLARTFAPYQFNPLDINPLREVLAEEVCFERVRACDQPRLFVSATHVRTGQLREFRHHEMSVDVVLASACLPMLFRAVEIDGHRGWVNYLAVAPAHRGHGHGRRLMQHVEQLFVSAGVPKVNLLVRSTNAAVIEFYRRLGYAQDEAVCLGKRLIPDAAR